MAPSNDQIADLLNRTAALLDQQDANPFRVRSYRLAADNIRDLDRSLVKIYTDRGKTSLQRIEGVGPKLSGSIAEIIETGELGLLDRLESRQAPEQAFQQLPGIGPELAARLHEELGVETLEELEQAAHDGRLAEVEGIGAQKTRGVRDTLAGRLGRSARRSREKRADERPPVGLLLAVDRTYRRKAKEGRLRKIAPKRFNPDNRAWLPILETRREGWSFTALFSNTRRAHALDKVKDWVVIYFQKDDVEDQCTVVTAGKGALEGRRVIRGRETECRLYYAKEGL